MATYTYSCQFCGIRSYEQHKFEDRPERIACHECQGVATYIIDTPGLTKASYIDGTKRKGWSEFREANSLVKEAAVSKRGTANEIRKEIRKMGVKVEK